VGVTRIESNRNRHFGLKIESKSIENRNLEIVTSLGVTLFTRAANAWWLHRRSNNNRCAVSLQTPQPKLRYCTCCRVL